MESQDDSLLSVVEDLKLQKALDAKLVNAPEYRKRKDRDFDVKILKKSQIFGTRDK